MILDSIKENNNDMKIFLSLMVLVMCVNLHAQNDIISTVKSTGGEKPCYVEAKERQKAFVDGWACGKLAGYIDCNDELEVDDASGIVIKKSTGMANLDGVGKPYTGNCESCNMNGMLARRIKFVDGKAEGIDTSFYESGCIQAIRNHFQGAQNGTWTYYYDSTRQIAWEMNYYVGEKHGKHVYMKANGDTTKVEMYKNGLLDGVKKSYYKDSKIFKEVTYAQGVMNGAFKTYNNEGILTEESNYKEGKKDLVCKYFYDDGVLLKTENWDNGTRNGEFKTFYYQGNLQVLETYKKGQKEGKFEEYYPDQKPKRLAVYVKNELVEEHLFDELGNETYTFGGSANKGAEDDELPGKKGKEKNKSGK